MLKLKISSKVLMFFLTVSLLPLLAVSIVLVNKGRALLLDAATTRQQTIASSTAFRVDNYLDDRIRALVLQSKLLSPTSLDKEIAYNNFNVLVKQDKNIHEVSLLDPKGVQKLKVDANGADYTQSDKASTDPFKAVSFLGGKYFVSSVSYDEKNNPSITIAVPLLPEELSKKAGIDTSAASTTKITSDQLLGVIVAKYDVSDLWQSVLSTTIGQGGYAYVVDSLGNLVTHPDNEFLGNNKKIADVEAVKNFIDEDFTTATTISETGENVVSTPIKLSNSNWAVIVQEPVSSVYFGINSFIRLAALILMLAVIFAISLSLLFRKQLLNPIKQLIVGTKKLSGGDFSYTVKVTSNDELRELANTFNSMSQDISRLISDLNIKNSNLDRATNQLSYANEQLKLADITKEEFISMASHQLGTPLAAIDGYLTLASEGYYGAINEKLDKTISRALGRTQVMKGLLLDLLDVSRMTANRFYLDVKATDLNNIISEEVHELVSAAEQARVQLTYHPPAQSLPLINLDEQKTRQAVMNLLTNAINYTNGGTVNVYLQTDGTVAQYTVVDNGIGVPENQKSNLFNKFYRADNAKNSRPNGTGIGLYLVKRVVEDQGGKIIFRSEQGKGSTFGFILPLNTNLSLGQHLPDSNDEKKAEA